MEKSDVFSVGRGVMFKTLLQSPKESWPLWSMAAVGFILVLMGVIFDVRFIAIGLMVCLTLIPTLAFFMFFKTMLSDEILPNLLPHSLTRSSEGFIVTVFKEVRIGDDSDEMQYQESDTFLVSQEAVVRTSDIEGYRVLWLKNAPLKLLFLPFADGSEELCSNVMTKNKRSI